MQPERWAHICEILDSSRDVSPHHRAGWLDQVCGNDPSLRAEVESLIAASGRDGWLDRPAYASIEVRNGNPARELEEGSRLGRYRLIEPLGRGAMGMIYKAEDEQLGRLAALKIISDSNVGAVERERFVREARAASALNHPNIVTIYEYGRDMGLDGNTVDFIAMEYIEGATLKDRLTAGSVPLAQALDWARQIASALSRAHAAGIVHRDLKPGNLMVTADGIVKILDFGIAMRTRSVSGGLGGDIELTLPGAILGTPAYMSPEQARGETVDYRSDIFSFGTILYELASGRRPFTGGDTLSILQSITLKPPQKAVEVNPRIPARLSELIGKCLAKDRNERLHDLGIAVDDLNAIRQSVAGSEQPGNRRQFRRPIFRKVLGWAAAVCVIGMVAIAGLYYLYYGRPRAHPPAFVHFMSATLFPDSAFDLTEKGRAKLFRYDRPEDLESAIQLLTQAITVNPQQASAYAVLSEAYRWKNSVSADAGWRNLSAQYASKAVAVDPTLALGHVALGTSLFERGERQKAAAEFRQGLDLDPRSAAAVDGLAKCAAAAGDRQKAESLFRSAVDLAPSDWIVADDLAIFRYRNGQFQSAATLLEKLRDLMPDNVVVRRNLSAAYHQLDREDDAASELQRAVEIRPYAPIYTNLGTIRFYQGRYFDALPLMERAVQLGANRYIDWGNLADVYRMLPGKQSKAAEAYATAIQLAREALKGSPDDPEVHSSLAVYLARSGDKSGAQKELQALRQLKRISTGSFFKAAIVSEICGARDEALEMLTDALRNGYPQREAAAEPDLIGLREDPRYHLLLTSMARTPKP